MKRSIVTSLFFTLLTMPLYAQIRGVVKDTTGEPIAGANVFWAGTTQGTTTDLEGRFDLRRHKAERRLVVSFIGYENDTIRVTGGKAELDIVLQSGLLMDEVEVVQRKLGTMKVRSSVMNEEMISSAELARAACCNLGESFTTNPSVDVSYSDAATGAKQIRLLGLSGTYVQMLTENIPNYRGTAAPYALGYIPGPWMQSIQVSKGSSSVKNGYESITGQINVEFKKPQAEPTINFNLYGNTKEKYEANFDGNIHLNKRLSTALLAHYENGTRTHDDNGDGFLDMPKVEQYNLQNRWAWMGDHYVFQASVKALKEERNSGQADHSHTGMMPATGRDPYLIDITTERYEAFTKNAYIFNKEKSTNVALILAGSLHKQDAGYGHKAYNVNQKNLYASLMFETNLNPQNSLSVGLSMNHDNYNQDYRIENDAQAALQHEKDKETVAGGYIQYTYNWADKLILMGGLRMDHSNLYGTFVTPRAHIKYSPNEAISLRVSAGKGYRTNHVLAENNYLLASGRRVVIDSNLQQDETWNYGISASFSIPLSGKNLSLNAEYYYTDFIHQLVTDMDSDPHAVQFRNLEGDSYSHTLQAEASYPFFKGFTLTAAYRYTDVKCTYNRQLLRKPLTSRYKGLLTASYQTPLALWQFDVTLQLNGSGRMPAPYTTTEGTSSWESSYPAYEQLSAQITRWFRHWSIYVGGENMTGFKQKNPIIAASNPYSVNFDSTMIWGPVHGAIYYIGLRINL
ncbi:MAG: TonB-dependent receptor domain-containing protein [Bacteroides sp.]